MDGEKRKIEDGRKKEKLDTMCDMKE